MDWEKVGKICKENWTQSLKIKILCLEIIFIDLKEQFRQRKKINKKKICRCFNKKAELKKKQKIEKISKNKMFSKEKVGLFWKELI